MSLATRTSTPISYCDCTVTSQRPVLLCFSAFVANTCRANMTSFGPSAQRTVFAVISVSAVGSGCYAWMARGSTGGRSPSAVTTRNPLMTAQGLSETFRTGRCGSLFFEAISVPGESLPTRRAGSNGEWLKSSDGGAYPIANAAAPRHCGAALHFTL